MDVQVDVLQGEGMPAVTVQFPPHPGASQHDGPGRRGQKFALASWHRPGQRCNPSAGQRGGRFVEQICGRALFHDLPGLHHDGLICILGGRGQVVCDHEHRTTGVGVVAQEVQDLGPTVWVELCGDFVGEHDLGVAKGGQCYGDSLSLPSGELEGIGRPDLLGTSQANPR